MSPRPVPLPIVRIDGAHALAPWFRRSYADYLAELSPFAPGAYSLDGSGVWQPDHVPFWLSDPNALALVALAGGLPRGFACVGTAGFPYKSASSDHRLAELFVEAPWRRLGLGDALAAAALGTLSGTWELSVLSGNGRALRFWRRVLPAVASRAVVESADPDEVRFRFTAGRAGGA